MEDILDKLGVNFITSKNKFKITGLVMLENMMCSFRINIFSASINQTLMTHSKLYIVEFSRRSKCVVKFAELVRTILAKIDPKIIKWKYDDYLKFKLAIDTTHDSSSITPHYNSESKSPHKCSRQVPKDSLNGVMAVDNDIAHITPYTTLASDLRSSTKWDSDLRSSTTLDSDILAGPEICHKCLSPILDSMTLNKNEIRLVNEIIIPSLTVVLDSQTVRCLIDMCDSENSDIQCEAIRALATSSEDRKNNECIMLEMLNHNLLNSSSINLLKTLLSSSNSEVVRSSAVLISNIASINKLSDITILNVAEKFTSDALTNKFTSDQLASKITSDGTNDKLIDDHLAGKVSNDRLVSRITSDGKTDKFIDDQVANKVIGDRMTDEVIDDKITDKFIDDQLTNKVTSDKMANKVTDDRMTDKFIDDQVTDKDIDDKITGEVTNDVVTSKFTSDGKTDKLIDDHLVNKFISDESKSKIDNGIANTPDVSKRNLITNDSMNIVSDKYPGKIKLTTDGANMPEKNINKNNGHDGSKNDYKKESSLLFGDNSNTLSDHKIISDIDRSDNSGIHTFVIALLPKIIQILNNSFSSLGSKPNIKVGSLELRSSPAIQLATVEVHKQLVNAFSNIILFHHDCITPKLKSEMIDLIVGLLLFSNTINIKTKDLLIELLDLLLIDYV